MRVLMCVPAYSPADDYGGPVTTIRLLATELVKLGVEVEILTGNFGPGRSRVEPGRRDVDGVPVTYARRLASRGWLSLSRGAATTVQGGNFDVIHAFGLRDGTVTSARVAAARLGIPVLLEPMGMAVPRVRSIAVKRIFDRIVRRLLPRATVTLATSNLEAEELRRLAYRPVVVRYNPAALANTSPTAHKLYDVCFIGRLHRKKQLQVFAEVLVQRPSARALVAGPDEDTSRADLESLATARGVRDRLELRGWLTPEQRDGVLAATKCFVMPSVTENFGNAAAEALRAGTPVVVTDQCGIAELVSAYGAGVVTSIEESDIVAAVLRLLDEPIALQRAAAASSHAVAELAPDVVAREQLAIYDSLVRPG